jgi:hypothetical protein
VFAGSVHTDGATSVIAAYHGRDATWSSSVPGSVGAMAATETGVFVALSSSGRWSLATGSETTGKPLDLHGDPSTVIASLDAKTGHAAWQLVFDATEWAVVTSLAPAPGGVVVGGTFAGTLRAGTKVVASAGKSEGFVASVRSDGALRWLVRVGGQGADSVQGVAARGDRVAIAGTFAAGADLLGTPLQPYDEKSPFADGFVAELDANTGARVWSSTFGSKADDAVAGVAIDSTGRVAVAATAREPIRVGGSDHDVRGASDGIVAWFTPTGDAGATAVIGGTDFDGLRAIVAVDDRVVVAGFFSGTLALGKQSITAGGGDDAFVATVNAAGGVESSWQIGGPGREEVVALASVPGGFLAGIAHTAAAVIGDDKLPAPQDPATGAALVQRPAP